MRFTKSVYEIDITTASQKCKLQSIPNYERGERKIVFPPKNSNYIPSDICQKTNPGHPDSQYLVLFSLRTPHWNVNSREQRFLSILFIVLSSVP